MKKNPLQPLRGNLSAAGAPARPLVHTQKSGGHGAVIVIVLVLLVMGGILFYVANNGNQPPAAPAAPPPATQATVAVEEAEAQKKPEKKENPALKTPKVKKEEAPAIKEEPAPQEQEPQPEPQEEPAVEEEPADEETVEEAPAEEEPADEPTEEDAEEELGTISEDDPEAVARFTALVDKSIEEENYEGLRDALRAQLESQQPELFVVKEPKKKAEDEEELPPSPYAALPPASQLKVKGKLTTQAMASYYCLELLLAVPDVEATDKEFMTFLLKDKHEPATALFKGLAKKKVSPDTAAEMMAEFRSIYDEDPKKAFRSINAITASANKMQVKKYYPHEKKEMEKAIADILKTRPGKGADKAQQDAINLSNVYRYVCGVAPSLKYDKEFGAQAEDAAAACARAGKISHDLGHSTDACNLHSGMDERVKSVPGYVHDPGGGNRAARGHRNWLLDPAAAKVAFGQSGTFHAMRVMDTSCTIKQKGPYSYPGRGYFPVRYLHGDGWSYHAGPAAPVGDNPKVEMWSLVRAPKKTITKADLKSPRAIPVKEIFAHSNYIVFEPDLEDSNFKRDKAGNLTGVYFVRVTWRGYKDEYIVEFY